ncbi:MAG TPA: hypothetical protein VGZ22_17270 [Isosphaeraceae bacterium]|nr:hypothetical protein [Isosphaeraceae bacterium]
MRRRLALWAPAVLVLAGLVGALGLSLRTSGQDLPSRQVTLVGILATSDSTKVDKKLKEVEPQLRQLLPGYTGGFKLLEAQSKRLTQGHSITCRKLDGFVAKTTLMVPLDDNGKVQLNFAFGTRMANPQNSDDDSGDVMQASTIVTTPPNQLSFFEKQLADGTRLIIGMAAR